MRSENPKVARARYRSVFIRGKKIFWTGLGGAFLGGVAKNAVDLAEGKSREFRIIELQVQQTLQLNCQDVTIPAGIFRQLVVRKHVSPPISFRHCRENDDRHRTEAEQLRRPQSAVTRNNLSIFGDKKGIGETEALDRTRDLLDLLL